MKKSLNSKIYLKIRLLSLTCRVVANGHLLPSRISHPLLFNCCFVLHLDLLRILCSLFSTFCFHQWWWRWWSIVLAILRQSYCCFYDFRTLLVVMVEGASRIKHGDFEVCCEFTVECYSPASLSIPFVSFRQFFFHSCALHCDFNSIFHDNL